MLPLGECSETEPEIHQSSWITVPIPRNASVYSRILKTMPIPLDVSFERTFSGTPKRIYQLLTEMGTSGDAIWPFASQPFMRSAGPLVPGHTEEWHLGLHAVLESVEPEKSIIWRIDNEGVDGTHGFTISQDGKKTTVTHRVVAQL